MPHLQSMEWDYRDQLRTNARQKVNGGTPETTWYVYDGGGKRVRKVTDNAADAGAIPLRKAERIYLSGFEMYREYKADGTAKRLEREALHVMDDKQRVAMVETLTIENGDGINNPVPLQRIQFGNHLGSSSLEVAGDGRLISYEEYHPYGTSAFQAGRNAAEVGLKRYRYTGKRSEEHTSELQSHSDLVCRLLLEKKKNTRLSITTV